MEGERRIHAEQGDAEKEYDCVKVRKSGKDVRSGNEDESIQEKEESLPADAESGGAHHVGWDPCGNGDRLEDRAWYAYSPGSQGTYGRDGGHGSGMDHPLPFAASGKTDRYIFQYKG